MKTLGEFLNRSSEKDSDIAAEMYNPGFDENSDERDPTRSLEPSIHDISKTSRDNLGAFAESLQNSENSFSSFRGNSYVERIEDFSAQTSFNLTSTNKSKLGDLLKNMPFGSSEHKTIDQVVEQFGRSTGNNYVNKVVPNTVRNQRSTAYPAPLSDRDGGFGNVNNAVQSTLEENLHAPGRAYLSEPGSEMEDGTIRDGLYSMQNGDFGKFDPQRNRMQVEDLRRAAEATLENARGIISNGDQRNDKEIVDILKSLVDFAMPGIAPIQGIYDIRISKIKAIKDKFGEIQGQDEIARVREDFNIEDLLTKGGGTTYGVLNAPSQVFDGPVNGMILTAFAGMLTLRGLIEVYGRFIHLLISSSDKDRGLWQLLPASVRRTANELGLKQNNLNSKDGFLKTFAAYWTNSDLIIGYAKKGLNIFYGYQQANNSDSIFSLFGYKSVFESPGYYANIARVILRDAEIIKQYTQQNADLNPGTIIPEFLNSISALAESLLTSPSFKLVVEFAKLGTIDRLDSKISNSLSVKSLSVPAQPIRKNSKYQLINENEQNDDDVLGTYQKFDDATIREVHSKRNSISNLRFGNLKFSSLSNRYYASLLKAGSAHSISDNTFYSLDYNSAGAIRFTHEQVDEIEKIIDTDYVPFSIQDVRTNEVLSLPSFIDSISDSFNVSYESTHGYGRTDPVHSYSKTERNINLSFVLIAFSVEDHKNVYNIINKLTSMCYPQRSAGTLRKDDGIQFTQPFSQIPTASPLIRIRLGDLFRNNRTAETFKSLFGDDGSLQKQVEAKIKSDREKNSAINKFSSYELEVGDTFRLNKIPFVKVFYNEENAIDVEFPSESIPAAENYIYEFVVNRKDKTVIMDNFATIERLPEDGSDSKTIEVFDPLSDSDSFIYTRKAYEYAKEVQGLDGYKLKLQDVTYFAFPKDAGLLSQYFEPAISEEIEIIDFYSAENNAVVRSFRSTNGRGLAGFIKDLQLDYSGFNWGVDSKFRAPMGVKVTMSFSPIHDAPLGLDHRGRMISPTHPVGYEYEGFK